MDSWIHVTNLMKFLNPDWMCTSSGDLKVKVSQNCEWGFAITCDKCDNNSQSCYLKTQLSKDIFDADIKIQIIYIVQDLENIWTLIKKKKKKFSVQTLLVTHMWPKVSSLRHYIQKWSLLTLKGKKALKLENLTVDQLCFQKKILIKGWKCKK